MSLFSRTPAPREVSAYISMHSDGHRTVSITGSLDEVSLLVDQVLEHPNTSAYPVTPMAPAPAAAMPGLRAPLRTHGSVTTEIY